MELINDLRNRLRRRDVLHNEEALLREAAQSELDDLAPAPLETVASTDRTTGGLDVSGRHVVSVRAARRRCHEVRAAGADLEDDPRTRRLKRNGRGVWWIDADDTLQIDLPYEAVRQATVYHVLSPEEIDDETDRGAYERALERLIILRAALIGLDEIAGSLRAEATPAPSLPDPPSTLDLSTEVDGQTDLEPPTINVSVTLPVAPTVPDTSVSFPDPPDKPTIPSITPDVVPFYSAPTDLSLDFSDFESYFDDEDTEMSTEALERLETEIREYQATVEEELGNYQAEIQHLSADVEEDVQRARIALEEYQSDVQAYVQEVQSLIEEKGLELETFQAELSKYQAEVQSDVSAAQVELEEAGRRIDKFRSQVERQVQQFQAALERYRARVEAELQRLETDVSSRQRIQQMIQKDRQRYQQRYQRLRRSFLQRGSERINPIPQ